MYAIRSYYAEMIQRIERRFGVSLPPQVLNLAETPRDLWREIQRSGRAGTGGGPEPAVAALELEAIAARPEKSYNFV